MEPIQKCAPARSMQLEAVYLEALLYIIGALNHLTIDTRLTGLTYDADGAPVRHLYDKETFVFFCTRSGYCFIAQGLKVHRKKKKDCPNVVG